MKTTTLYHYTDFFALNGILGEKELRVNNVLNMNDAEEMQLFLKGLFNAIQTRLLNDGEAEKSRRLHEMYTELEKNKYEFSAYAACFSTYRDDASQWERYANRGKGVCLGFRRSVLEKITNRAISLHKVFYRDNVETHPLVDKLYSAIRESTNFSRPAPELRDVLLEVWHNSASFKHPSFSSEHEIRLVVMPFNKEDFNVRPHYHVSRERIKKYYPLYLDEICGRAKVKPEDLFTELIVGPESTQSVPILQDYLRDLSFYKLADHVYTSNCPLRSKI